MMRSSGSALKRLLITGGVLLFVFACDSGSDSTSPSSRFDPEPSSRIITPTDTGDSISTSSCSIDDKHCPMAFYSPSTEEFQWMQDAADATTCPWMQQWMNNSILHGWVHLTDEASHYGLNINAATHVPDPATVDPTNSRVHLDVNNAFTGSAALAHTFRHETAHVYGYGRMTDSQADSVANSCGG